MSKQNAAQEPSAEANVDEALTDTRPEIVRLAEVKRIFGDHPALNGVSLSVRQGEILGVIGRSGAGKSTLIRCLNGLERPDEGVVSIEGKNTSRLSETELQPVRRRIGMIFQHFNLLSARTVEDNIALPLKIAGWPREKRLARAAELIELVGLSGKAKAWPSALSGGQKQRVGIARALAANPALLLSDEATSALDPETTHSILTLLKQINRELGLTIVLITHEMEVVRAIADRVIVLEAGKIVEEGAVWQVFSNPQTDMTRRLLGDIRPHLPPEVQETLTADPGGEAVLQIDVAGEAARAPLLSDFARETKTAFRLLQGGVDHIQGQPVARFFLALDASAEDHLASSIEFLTARRAQVEHLGYVARPV